MTRSQKQPGVRSKRLSPRDGFALIVTVAVLVLLSLVAIGLLTLSTLTVRSTSIGGAQAEARANARLALMLAIGDLQKAAGPDQRITAPADMASSERGFRLKAGESPVNNLALDATTKGLSVVQPGTRYWTGVFSNRDTPELVYEKTPAPRIERWLVSGYRDPKAEESAITPALPACTVGPNGGVPDPAQAAVLVGPRSTGSGPGAQERYVAAPLVEMNAGARTGLRGAFAYWVGDEGVKARINMPQRIDEAGNYTSLPPQRRGWEAVDGFADYPSPAGDDDQVLARAITLPTADLLIPSLAAGNPSPRQSVFHSATTESRGLIVDTLDGGTRVDLTSAFSDGLPSKAPPDAYDNFPVSGGRVVPEKTFPGLRHLTWDHLARFHNLRGEISGDTLEVSGRTSDDTASIAPIVTDFRILMGVRLEAIEQRGRPTNRYHPHPCGKIAIAIANPYSLPLEWDREIEFEIKNQTPPGNRPSRIWQIDDEAVYIPSDGSADRPGREAAVFNQAVFRIGPGRLDPGEARAYTHAGKVSRPSGVANRRQVVELAPFTGSAPFDFNNCLEMTTSAQITLPKTMDVRESWQTTLVMLEMRLGGSRGRYSWLRRIERFELDNGYFAPNQRTFNSRNVAGLTGPVPLMLYSFQISQPGTNYLSLMPRGYEGGQRGSTLRTFADFNLRATNFHKPITSYNPPPFFMESNDSAALLPFRSPGGDTGTGFTRNLAVDPLYWGRSGESGSTRTVLFSVPREIASLAQFQHADLTNDDKSISIVHQPGNAFGNSYATPFVRRDVTQQRRVDYEIIGSPNRSGARQFRRNYYDVSHILNNCLWDRYFLSTIPPDSTLPANPNFVPATGGGTSDVNDAVEAAGGLMLNGAFNVNSTEEDAWTAFLASARHLAHPADEEGATEAAFPRSLEQPEAHILPATGTGNDSYAGYRRLTDDEIANLAAEIVRQVRLRGPFVSLSHFVNRALAPLTEERELTRAGALQVALDESGVNISHDGSLNGFARLSPTEERVTFAAKRGAPRADVDGGDLADRPRDANPRQPDWARTSRDNNFGSVASILADREMLLDDEFKREQGYRSTGIPGWVTQADVLQVIGPAISARSDTFRIRACGEARDPAGNVLATAWCEAIVQRQPYFVDRSNSPHERGNSLTRTNRTYGRRFELVSFRWLSAEEI
jgi:hypothetical protein